MAYLVVFMCILLETTEQTCYTLSGKTRQTWQWLSAGIGIHVFAMICWFWLLTLLPLGIAVPLMGTSFAAVALVSKKLFHEKVDKRRWVGIFCIMAGLALVAGAID